MTKQTFLDDQHVQAMLPWLRERVARGGHFVHHYQDRQSGEAWTCDGLHDAFTSYRWNGKDWRANKQELDEFRLALRDALARNDSDATFSASEAILRWGGVWANNGAYLARRRGVLISEVRHLADILSGDKEPTPDMMLRVQGDRDSVCQMNAGFVKIYSVLLDNFVIYDGRVGAALGLLVRHFCEETDRDMVPDSLAFAYGSPKEGPNPRAPKRRNPSSGRLTFPKLRNDSRFHSAQAMRASWLLAAALDGQASSFSPGEDGFHELAAALFMIGYDLPEPSTP